MDNQFFFGLLADIRRYKDTESTQFFVLGQASAFACMGKIEFWEQAYIENVSAAQRRGIAA